MTLEKTKTEPREISKKRTSWHPLWWMRSVLSSVLFLFWTFLLSGIGFILNAVFNRKSIDDKVISIWGKGACFLHNVKVEIEGLENLPKGSYLLLFNHSSFFDIFALVTVFADVRFGAKSELFKIPLFGHAMHRTGALPISRQRREETFKVYEEARPRFLAGERFALSPEGGRFFGENLSSFKAGPFLFAMSAGVPLVPVMILGAHEVLPIDRLLANTSSCTRTIQIKVLPPIPTSNFNSDQRQILQAQAYEQMNREWRRFYSNLETGSER